MSSALWTMLWTRRARSAEALKTADCMSPAGGVYRLLLGESISDAPEHILSEFGAQINSIAAASHTREHWRCIAEGNALKKLSGN